MFLVGLTGGIASGKSSVAQMLITLGCPLIDADLLAREVVEPGEPAWHHIKKHFGAECFQEDGTLNRGKLGDIIFHDDSKRRLLNSITHPQIHKRMAKKVLLHFLRGKQFVVVDIPLLIEGNSLLRFFSFVLVVYCDEKTQLERLKTRNKFTDEEALSRIRSQIPLIQKCEKATHVIDNSGDIKQTKQQVESIYKELLRCKKHWRVRLLLGGVLVSLMGLIICHMRFWYS